MRNLENIWNLLDQSEFAFNMFGLTWNRDRHDKFKNKKIISSFLRDHFPIITSISLLEKQLWFKYVKSSKIIANQQIYVLLKLIPVLWVTRYQIWEIH